MIIDFNTNILNIDGTVIKNENGDDLNAKTICINYLLAPTNEVEDGTKKLKRYQLAIKIQDNEKLNLEVEDIAFLKEVIGKTCTPLVIGRMYEILENETSNFISREKKGKENGKK